MVISNIGGREERIECAKGVCGSKTWGQKLSFKELSLEKLQRAKKRR